MKFRMAHNLTKENRVAPLAGAWIEIVSGKNANDDVAVAPLAGAWIEILKQMP